MAVRAPGGHWWQHRPLAPPWGRRKARAFPAGAITFHLAAWARSGLSQSESDEAAALLGSWGFDSMFVLHGNALTAPGEGAVIVLGPSGVGKSTICASLVSLGRAELLEDGLVVVGSREKRWYVLETGTLGVLSRASRISSWLRRVTGSSRKGSTEIGGWWSAAKRRGDRLRARVAFVLAVLSIRDTGRHLPRLFAVTRLVVARGSDLDRPELRLAAAGPPLLIRDISGWVPDTVDLVEVPDHADSARVRDWLRLAVLGVAPPSRL